MVRRRQVGRIRQKMAEMLQALGLEVSAFDIWIQEGAYRSVQMDLARWGVSKPGGVQTNDKYPGGAGCCVTLYSYDLMTECVRYGITLSPDNRDGWRFVDIYSNKGKEKT